MALRGVDETKTTKSIRELRIIRLAIKNDWNSVTFRCKTSVCRLLDGNKITQIALVILSVDQVGESNLD